VHSPHNEQAADKQSQDDFKSMLPHSIAMTPSQLDYTVYVVFGFILGMVMTWLIRDAIDRWRRGRGLMEVPDRVRQRHEIEIAKAKEDRSQGCREVMRSLGYFFALLLLIFFVMMVVAALWPS